MRDTSDVFRSGVPLLDDWLSGLRARGTHVLTGGPGTGKSTIALHFADAGLRRGESVAMLVHSRADDVKSHARLLGVDLNAHLRSGRLLLLRYRPELIHAVTHGVSPEQAVSDFGRIVLPYGASRIIIDTFSPFVAGAPPVAPCVVALTELLERSGSTSLLTFPEELAAGYDRTLEPLMQSAAAIIRLAREDADVRRAEVLTLRYPPPPSTTARFMIRPGSGIVSEQPLRLERFTLRHP